MKLNVVLYRTGHFPVREGLTDELREQVKERGRWLSFFKAQAVDQTAIWVFVNWRPLLIMSLVGLVGIYFAVAGGLAWWYARNPFNRITYADVAAPWKWTSLRRLRAQAWEAEGTAQLDSGAPGHGVFFLRLSLTTHPNNAAARITLARYFARGHYLQGVKDTVMPQLDFPDVPRELIQILFEECARTEDATLVLEVVGKMLDRTSLSTSDRRWYLTRQADALVASGEFERALVVTEKPEIANAADTISLRVGALCGLKRYDEAIALARTLPSAGAGEVPFNREVLIRAIAQAGKIEELKKESSALIAAEPARPRVRSFVIETLWTAGLHDEARAELVEYLRRFSRLTGELLDMTRRLAEAGAVDLVKMCYDDGRARGVAIVDLKGMWLFSLVGTGRWEEAEELYALITAEQRLKGKAEVIMLDWERAVLDASHADTLPDALKSVIERKAYSPMTYASAARGFAMSGNWAMSQVVAEAGLEKFPGSGRLKILAADARVKAEALAPKVAAKPTVRVLDRETYRAELADFFAKRDWDNAIRLINEVRASQPSWFREDAVDVSWQEARVAFERDDRARLRQLIILNLPGRPSELPTVIKMAETYAKNGDATSGLIIAQAAVAALPSSQEAADLVRKLKLESEK